MRGGAGALCCRVYVTEGRNGAVLGRLEAAARGAAPGCALAHVHRDAEYHRTGFTLAAREAGALARGATRLAREALAEVRRGGRGAEAASHPRLGAVDHISFHPVPGAGGDGEAGPREAAEAARAVGAALGEGELAVPVHLYGGCHPQGRALADLRRELGYFSGQSGRRGGAGGPGGAPKWEGGFAGYERAGLRPAFGPATPPADLGVTCVGSTPWLVNYNVPLDTSDFDVGRDLARAVSARGGGPPGVQAMALRHGRGLEVACNPTAPEAGGGEPAVLRRIRALAATAGVTVGAPYRIGPAPADLRALLAEREDRAGGLPRESRAVTGPRGPLTKR